MSNNSIEDIPLMKICSVWLFFDNADYSRIKLWSQIIGCPEDSLGLSIKNVQYLHNNKTGIKTEDGFLELIYRQMKNLTTAQRKDVFQKMRKKSA